MDGYGVGTQARRLLHTYWRILTMVVRARGYYGTALQGARRVTHGYPPSPTIFNVVANAVLRHWVTGVIGDTEERGNHGKEVRHQAALFYAYDGMVASSDPRWLQGAFNALVGLFYRVSLQKNVGKIVGMVCHPFHAAGNLSEAAYGRRFTGKAPRTGSY